MRIVVGVGKSSHSQEALRAAIAIARVTHAELTFVHSPATALEEPWSSGVRTVRRGHALIAECVDIARSSGAIAFGRCDTERKPADAILQAARDVAADFIVAGARSTAGGIFGFSPAVQLSQSAPIPTLVIRDAEPFVAAAQGARLRILLATDLTADAMPAISWTAALAKLVPSVITAAFSADPVLVQSRFEIGPPNTHHELDRRVRFRIEQELGDQIAPLRPLAPVELLVEPDLGGVASHLERIARSLRAGAIVLAARQRKSADSVTSYATSREIVASGERNVFTVPVAWNAAPSLLHGPDGQLPAA